MTYAYLPSNGNLICKSDRWISFILALLIHASFMVMGSKVLIQPARYGVEPGFSSMEVSLVTNSPEAEPLYAPRVYKGSVTVDEPLYAPGVRKSDAAQGLREGAWTRAKPGHLRNPPPRYPEESRQRGEEGLVRLLIHVGKEGAVRRVRVKQSSGFELLDDAAVKAVGRWRFEPARLAGLAVDSKAEVPIRFRLREGES